MLLLAILVVLGLLAQKASHKRIIPAPGRQIELSINNKNELSDYTFNFFLETDSLEGYDMHIKFPLANYPSITAGNSCIARLKSGGNRLLKCQINSEKIFVVRIDNLSNGLEYLHSLTIENIQNPASHLRGSGVFSLRVMKGTLNQFDFNDRFGQVGFTDDALGNTLTIDLVSGNEPNQLATYKISSTIPRGKIKENGSISIILPDLLTFDSSLLEVETDFLDGAAPTLAFPKTNIIDIINIPEKTAITDVQITLKNIKNHGWVSSPGTFLLYHWSNGTHTLLERGGETAPALSNSQIPYDSQNILVTNFKSAGYPLVAGDTHDYEFKFKTINPLPEGCSIRIDFPAGYSISKCWAIDKLIDISSSIQVSCNVVGSQMIFTGMRRIFSKTQVSVGFRGTNPITTGATGNFRINTYFDSTTSKLVDASADFTFTISSTINKPTSYNVNNAITMRANDLIEIELNFQPSTTITNGKGVYRLHKSFTVVGSSGTIECDLYANGGGAIAKTCDYEVNSNLETEIKVNFGTSLDSTTTQKLVFKVSGGTAGVKSSKDPGEYYISGGLYTDIADSSPSQHATTYLIVQEAVFDTALTSVYSFTKDFDRKTVYEFSLYMPFPLDHGQWLAKSSYSRTYIEIRFPTKSASETLFASDLGSGVADGGKLPCYGIVTFTKYALPKENDLYCTITHSASLGSDVVVRVEGYEEINKEGISKIHFPGLKNPTSQSVGATIDFAVYRVMMQQVYKQVSGSYTLSASVPYNILENDHNIDGPNLTPTNPSPIFFPSNIFESSYMLMKMTPLRNIQSGGGLIVFFPSLPATDPQDYILPRNYDISCSYNGKSIDCYSYPESSILLINNLQFQIPLGDECIIRVDGFTNPSYVVDLHNYIMIWSYTSTFREDEQFKFTNLAPFDFGVINTAYVLPYRYESLQTDVTYDWIFIITDDLPDNGKIILYFPANYYDLESSIPCPIITLVEGVEWIDSENNPNIIKASCSDLFSSSIATVDRIKPIKAGTEILVRITGVKNPSQEGWTPYFKIETKNQEGYVIDRINTIPQIYITRKNDVKNIIFDSFSMSPTNGYLIGNYELAFFPQTTIPKFGIIEVTLPTAEFDPTDYPANKICKVGGSLKTLYSCTFDSVQAIVRILTDEQIEVEPGMEPIIIKLPHILNFNPELSSGVIKVTTSFDGLVINESGSDETNRKCVTTKLATEISVDPADSFTFSVFPRTEGSPAKYTWAIPVMKDTPDARLMFEFPYEFTRGLGDNLVCSSPELEIGPLDSIRCSVSDWTLNLTNTKGLVDCPCIVNVEVYGIVNPNIDPAITNHISIYVYSTATEVSEYTYSGGLVAPTAAGTPILEDWRKSSSMFAREMSEYTFSITSSDTGQADRLFIHFEELYEIPIISPSIEMKTDGDNPTEIAKPFTIRGNTVEVATPGYTFTGGAYRPLQIKKISNPYHIGKQRYPVVEFVQDILKETVFKMYPNLVIDAPFDFTVEKRTLILETPFLTLDAGTFSDGIRIYTTDAAPLSDISINLTFSNDGLVGKNIVLKAGTKETFVRVGHDLLSHPREAYCTFSLSSEDGEHLHFANIEPLKVQIVPSTNVGIFVTDFATLAAGGRSLPLVLFLDKAPFKNLEVGIYQIGKMPDRLGVWPPSLKYLPGEKKKYFWLSNDYASKGSEGSIIFTLSGETRSVYNFPNREKKFYIYEGRTDPPVVISKQIRGPDKDNNIDIRVQTDSPCTIYFSVVPRGSDIKFSEIRNKKMALDNYVMKYKLGEWIEPSDDYSSTFKIPNIELGLDQELKLFMQNSDGVISSAIRYRFSTIIPEPPMLIYILLRKGASTSTVYDKIKAAIVSGDRLSTTNPNPELFFVRTYSEGVLLDPGYPKYKTIDDLKTMYDNLQTLKAEIYYQSIKNALVQDIFIFSETGVGELENDPQIAQTTENMNYMNEKRKILDNIIDLGWSQEEISKKVSEIDKYTSKTPYPMEVGKSFSEASWLFTTLDPLSDYRNNTFYIPPKENYQVVEVYISGATKDEDKRAREVWYEIEDKITALRAELTDIEDLYPGTLHLRALRWSAANDPFLKSITPTNVTIGGISAAEKALEMYYIAILLERTDYDSQRAINSSRIRYLNDVDDACEEITSLNTLSISCDGSKINKTYEQADIINFTRLYELPTAEQIIAGLDMNNYEAPIKGNITLDEADTYSELQISGLSPRGTYAIFFALHSTSESFTLTSQKNETVQLLVKMPNPTDVSFKPMHTVYSLFVVVLFLLYDII